MRTRALILLSTLYFGPFLFLGPLLCDGRALGAEGGAAPVQLAASSEPGEPMEIRGTLYGADGETPVAGAEIFVYHTDIDGYYSGTTTRSDNPRIHATLTTDDHGAFFKGLAMEFIAQLPEIQAPMNILHHNVTTVNIALDGDYGEGEVYVLAFHQVATEDKPVDLLIGGRYFDRYERRAGTWKFSHRAVVADWATFSDPSAVRLDHPMVEGSHIGRPGPDDPSYEFFRLLTRGRRTS